MARIALTGASGRIGRELLDAFGASDEVLAFTHTEHDDIDSEPLDVTDPADVSEKLVDADVVIHLAGASSPDAEWQTVAQTNIHGTKHVLDAAVENEIDRVVFASSNHAVGTYNAIDDDPERMVLGYARPVDASAPTRPDSYYGVSKAACEGLTNYYADRMQLEIVNLRIGWYMSEIELGETLATLDDPGKRRFAKALWLSPRDCRSIHRVAATVDLPTNPVTVNAVSRNDERFYTITEAMRLLGYEPRDNSGEVLSE